MNPFRMYVEANGAAALITQVEDAWKKDLRQQFSDVPDRIYNLCFERAWERANDKGHDAVYDDLLYVLEFTEAIIQASRDA